MKQVLKPSRFTISTHADDIHGHVTVPVADRNGGNRICRQSDPISDRLKRLAVDILPKCHPGRCRKDQIKISVRFQIRRVGIINGRDCCRLRKYGQTPNSRL